MQLKLKEDNFVLILPQTPYISAKMWTPEIGLTHKR
jgi:hypothetical protein